MYDILELNKKLVPELKDIAKNLKIKKIETLRKQDLIYKILDQQAIDASKTPQVTKKASEEKPHTKKTFDSSAPKKVRTRSVKKDFKAEKVMSVNPQNKIERNEPAPKPKPHKVVPNKPT